MLPALPHCDQYHPITPMTLAAAGDVYEHTSQCHSSDDRNLVCRQRHAKQGLSMYCCWHSACRLSSQPACSPVASFLHSLCRRMQLSTPAHHHISTPALQQPQTRPQHCRTMRLEALPCRTGAAEVVPAQLQAAAAVMQKVLLVGVWLQASCQLTLRVSCPWACCRKLVSTDSRQL